jgi:hypothetical protein
VLWAFARGAAFIHAAHDRGGMTMAEDLRELCGAHELFFGVLGGNAQLIETVFEIIRQ